MLIPQCTLYFDQLAKFHFVIALLLEILGNMCIAIDRCGRINDKKAIEKQQDRKAAPGCNGLTNFRVMLFLNPQKPSETSGFLKFSRGIEMKNWPEMG